MTDPRFEVLVSFVIGQLVQDGKSEPEVVDMLVKDGIDSKAATDFVEKAAKLIEETNYKNAWKEITIGVIMTIAGIISTMMFYVGGWIVSITIGLILAGIVLITKGLKNYNIF